jgi:hypothetical protein
MINKPVLKVKDHATLFRDPYTKAIVVVDSVAKTNYNNQKAIAIKNQVANNEILSDSCKECSNHTSQL